MNTTSFNGKLRTFNTRHSMFGTTYSNDFVATPIYGSASVQIYTSQYGSSDISPMSSVNTIFSRTPTAMVVDNQGDFYLSATSIIYKIDKAGAVVASQSSGFQPTLYSDGDYIYFVEDTYSFSKYDKILNKVWSHTQSESYSGSRGTTSDLNSNVYVSYGSGVNSKVNKLSATGSLLWTATSSNTVVSLVTDKYGYLYIGQSAKAMVKKVDSSGTSVYDKSVTYGTFSSYAISHMSISDSNDTMYISVGDSTRTTSATPSVPVISYDLDLNQITNLGVYAANTVAFWLPSISVGGSQYVYLVKPLSMTASVVEKWDGVSYTKLATSQVIYHNNPGFFAGPSLLVNPIQ